MAYANTFQRAMIWGLVGLLVVSALPMNVAFAQTTPLEFTSGTSVSIVGSVVRVQWGYASGAPGSSGTVQVYYNSQDSTVPFSTSSAHAATKDPMGLADIPLSSFTAGATYYFKVLAWDPARGDAAVASEIKLLFIPSQTATVTPPNAPSSFNVKVVSASSLEASWSAPSGTTPTEYQLAYRTSGQYTYGSVDNANFTCPAGSSEQACKVYTGITSVKTYTEPLVISNLSADTNYHFALRACSGTNNCSPIIVTQMMTSSAVTLPAAPTITEAIYSTIPNGPEIQLKVTVNTTNVDKTRLYWHRVNTSWPSPFRVAYRSEPSGDEGTWEEPPNVGGIQFAAPALGGNYEVQLHACNVAGNCSVSNIATVTVPGATTTTAACTLTTNKTTYTTADNVSYTFTCPGSVTTTAIEVAKPDGTVVQYNSRSGQVSTQPWTETMGFGTSNLPAGSYTLRLCMNSTVTPCPPESPRVSVLFTITSTTSPTGTGTIVVHVKDSSGAFITSQMAHVDLRLNASGTIYNANTVGGIATFSQLPAGSGYGFEQITFGPSAVTASSIGLGTYTLDPLPPINLEANATKTLNVRFSGTITIQPTLPTGNAGVKVVVKDPNGAVVPGAMLGLRTSATATNGSPATTGADGSWTYSGILAGTYVLGIEQPSNRTDLKGLPDQSVSLDPTIPTKTFMLPVATATTGAGRIQMTVKDPSGNVVVGANATLTKNGTLVTSGPTSATGYIEFTSLVAGTYIFNVTPSSTSGLNQLGAMTITIGEGTTFTQTVFLGKSSGTIPGVIPAKPTGVSASGMMPSSLTVSWVQDSNAAFYEIKKKEASKFAVWGDVSDYAQAKITPYTLTGLKSLTTYYVAIRACNSNNECSPYDEVSGVTAVDTTPPSSVAPVIQRLEPAYGPIGTPVKLFGSGFGATGNNVRIGGWNIGRFASQDGMITFAIPAYFDPCPPVDAGMMACMAMPMQVQPGTYPVTVSVDSGPASNPFQFSVTSTTEPPNDQCFPSDNEADWFCVQKTDGYKVTVMSRCGLEKMRIFEPNLTIFETGKRCAEEQPIPEPVQTGVVKGRVIARDATTGKEIGVRTTVYLRPQAAAYTYGTSATAGFTDSKQTSDDGSFTFTAIRPGGYVLSAELPPTGFTRDQEMYPIAVAASASTIQNIFFTRIGTPTPIPGKGGVVIGRVTDYTGKKLAGLDVWLDPIDFSLTTVWQPKKTDEQGVYTFPSVIPGKYRLGVAMPPLRSDLAPLMPSEIGVAVGVTIKRDFVFMERREQGIGLPPGDASVKGTVKANDAPLAGATVQLKRRDGTGFGFMHTDAFGVYAFPNIAVAEYHMSVYPPPLQANFEPIEEDIVLSASGSYKDFTLIPREGVLPTPIQKGTATIRGRVFYRDALADHPMKTNVFLSQYSSRGPSAMQSQTTTEDGAFIFADLPAGTYDLSAAIPPYASENSFLVHDLDFYKITVAAGGEQSQDIFFKKGRMVPAPMPMPISDIDGQYGELKRVLTDRRQMLANMIKDIAKKGGVTQELVAIQDQLDLFLKKAESARRASDRETLQSLFIELGRLEQTLSATIERLFRTAGNGEFINRVKGLLAEAPKYAREMSAAIDEREKRGEDVTAFRDQLDEMVSLREKAQALFDAGKVERVNDEAGAGDLAFAMLDRGQQLYCALGIGGGNCAVALTGVVKTPAYIRTTLGKNADKEYKAFVKNVATDSTAQFTLEAALPTLSPEQMQAMFDINKTNPNVLKPIVEHLDRYDESTRARVLETNIEAHSAVQDLRGSREALDEITGISRAARESVDNLRKQLEKFVFPPGTGELILEELRTLNDTIVNGTIKNPRTLNGYIQGKFATINVFIPQAVQEKFKQGYVPATNVPETSPIFAEALALRETGALNVVLNKKGEIPLLSKPMAGRTFVPFFETAVDDTDAIAGKTEQQLMKSKTVTGQQVLLFIVGAHDLELTNRIRQNRAQFAAFMTSELGVKVTAAQLAKPVTTSQVIAWVGAAEEKFGGEEENFEEVTQ